MKKTKGSSTPRATLVGSTSEFCTAAKIAGLVPMKGKKAVKNQYRTKIDLKDIGAKFTASVDLDDTF